MIYSRMKSDWKWEMYVSQLRDARQTTYDATREYESYSRGCEINKGNSYAPQMMDDGWLAAVRAL